MRDEIAQLRREYALRELRRGSVDSDPIRQFGAWFAEAIAAEVLEPNAMALATVGADGRPSVRVVLLKGFDERGFTFFTNLESRKARDIAAAPLVALTFFWKEIERQIRIEGRCERVDDEEADTYFASRPLGSQLGAWASSQSAVLASRDVLEARVEELAREFEGRSVPRPPFWGGFRVIHSSLEFWHGRPSRLHDRLRYELGGDGTWSLERLSP